MQYSRLFIITLASTALFAAGCEQKQPIVQETQPKTVESFTVLTPSSTEKLTFVGGDRDEHGCIGSAGYSWCESKKKCLRIWEESCLSPSFTAGKMNILVSTQKDATAFCNGDAMDSDGYRKTIAKIKGIVLPTTDRTDEERIKSIALAATSGKCREALKEVTFTKKGSNISISPIDAWAGISIALCSCKPEVEINLLRLNEVKNIIWE
ncbi:MAG: hypothetical protein WCO53_15255 [Deltaproteobacteria bacterium]